jgi:hypothetical protein
LRATGSGIVSLYKVGKDDLTARNFPPCAERHEA